MLNGHELIEPPYILLDESHSCSSKKHMITHCLKYRAGEAYKGNIVN